MKKGTKNLTIGILFVLAFLLNPVSVIPVTAAPDDITMPARDEILWSAGHWAGPVNWNPYFWGGIAWGGFFMYMPLFDINYETGTLVPFLGESLVWENSTTLVLKIQDEATWSDGVDITTDDFIFTWSYLLAAHEPGIPERVASYEKIDNKTVKVHLKPEYAYSKVIWDRFLGNDFGVVGPKHVWTEIVQFMTGKDPDPSNPDDTIWDIGDWAFRNDWLDAEFNNSNGFPEAWKVGCGPYRPYFVSDTFDRQIYIRDDNWWGNDVWSAPRPKYIGQLHFPTNFAMNQAFGADEIDWYGGYYPRIWELLEVNPNIQTWTLGKEPYFLPISGMVEIVPNHNRYPFNQYWLREALAYAIQYEDCSEVSASGYLQRARQGYIDDRSPTQRHVYDEEVQDTYGIDFNLTKAKEIMEANAFLYDDGTGEAWYSNDVPVVDRGMYGHSNVTLVDEVTDAEATAAGINSTTEPGYTDGSFNVKLSDWDILTVYGWSDSMMQTTLWATYWTDLKITTNPLFIDYGTYISSFEAMDFDLMNFVMGFGPIGRPWAELGKFTGDEGQWTNFTGWHNPEYNNLHDEWETVAPDNTTGVVAIASRMQEILASVMPAIPLFPNGFWAAYNTKYWHGWANEDNNYIHPTACWSTANIGAQLLYILNLIPAAEDTTTTTPTTTEPTTTTEEDTTTEETTEDGTNWAFGSVIAATIGLAVLFRRRRKK